MPEPSETSPPKPSRRSVWVKRAVVAGVVLVGMVAGGRVAVDNYIRPAIRENAVEEAMRANPMLWVIQTDYPESAARVRAAIGKLYDGTSTQTDVAATVSAELQRLRRQAMPRANQENTLATMTFARDQFEALLAKSEPECDTFAMDGTTTKPMVELLDRAWVEREQSVVVALLTQAARAPATWPNTVGEADVDAILTSVTDKFLAGLPAAQRADVERRMIAGEPVFACRRTIALFDAFLALPPERAAAILQVYDRMNTAITP